MNQFIHIECATVEDFNQCHALMQQVFLGQDPVPMHVRMTTNEKRHSLECGLYFFEECPKVVRALLKSTLAFLLFEFSHCQISTYTIHPAQQQNEAIKECETSCS